MGMATYRSFSGIRAEWGAVILAAGRGHRMGGPKAWQIWHGRSFLEWILEVLRHTGTPPVAVVVAPDTPPLPGNYPRPIRRLINPRPDFGPAGSLWRAWRRIVDPEDWSAVLVWPVDFPAVPPEVVLRLLEAYRTHRSNGWIWRPHDGTRPGHPILLHRDLGRWLLLPPVHRRGIRYLQRLFADRVVDVAVRTPTIHWNMNTPAHLRQYAPVWQPGGGSLRPGPRSVMMGHHCDLDVCHSIRASGL